MMMMLVSILLFYQDWHSKTLTTVKLDPKVQYEKERNCVEQKGRGGSR